MQKKNYMIVLTTLFLIFMFLLGYCFYPRRVRFELTQKINISEVDHPLIVLSEKDVFERFLKETLNSSYLSESLIGFTELDFNKYDYILTFNKELSDLKWSPYLSKKNDLCSYLQEKPVIPKYKKGKDNLLYIYSLKKKNKYRAICP